jgi:hypothetical protein
MQVMTAGQWKARGVSGHLLPVLIRSGALVPLRRGVYATQSAVQWAGTDPVKRHLLHVMAVRSVVGRRAVASYHSAAILHQVDLLKAPREDVVTLTLPPGRPWNRAKPANITFHSAELPKQQLTTFYRVPVTTAARTVADLARTLPFTDAVVAADSALREEKVTKADLDKVLNGCARWPGVRQARSVVKFADERAESPLESAARVVFHQSGLDPPELQATVFVPHAALRVDFLWREVNLVAEADGLMKYTERTDLIRQFERDRQLRDAGFNVVHFTWQELFATPEDVVERVRRAAAATTPF